MPDDTWMNNFYDASGMRVAAIENSIRSDFTIDRGSVIAENSSGKNVRYIRGLGLVANQQNQGEYSYYLQNAHGDVVNLVNGNGEILNSYNYDAFGNATTYAETVANRFTYAGEQFDKVTGQYYLRARYYAPQVGRFVTEDSYLGEVTDPLSLNLYTYCANDPINYTDPDGHWMQLVQRVLQWASSTPAGRWITQKSAEIETQIAARAVSYVARAGQIISQGATKVKDTAIVVAQKTSQFGQKIAEKAGNLFNKTPVKTTREKLLDSVSNQKLKNAIDQIYRPGAKAGDGGLADAIRHQLSTGELVGGKDHLIKGVERVTNLQNIIKSQNLSKCDLKIAQKLLDDLKNALGGK